MLFQSVNHAENGLKTIRKYWEQKKLFDVTLIAGKDGKRVPAHRLILCAYSEYFGTSFNSGLRETTAKEVTLGEVSGDILVALVEFCYTGKLQLQRDNVEELLQAASLLQFEDVNQACGDFMAKNLEPNNCLGVAFLAERLSLDTLQQKADAYICANFVSVSENEEFVQIGKTQLAQLLAKSDLCVRSEEQVFNGLISWLQHDPINRKKFLPELLLLVRLPLLKPGFIEKHVRPVCEDAECRKILKNALLCQGHRTTKAPATALMEPQWKMPRIDNVGTLISVGQLADCGTEVVLEKYCPLRNEWTVFHTVDPDRCCCILDAAALLKDKLIIFKNDSGDFDSYWEEVIMSFDFTSYELKVIKPMNTLRHSMGVAVLDDALYIAGGDHYKEQGILKSVERYNSQNNEWEFVAPMTKEREKFDFVVLNNLLYAVCGRGHQFENIRQVECYDPNLDLWRMCAPFPDEITSCIGAAAFYKYIYTVTVISEFSKIHRYDPTKNEWIHFLTFNDHLFDISRSPLIDRLIFVGVTSLDEEEQPLWTVEYDLLTGAWSQKAELSKLDHIQSFLLIPSGVLAKPE